MRDRWKNSETGLVFPVSWEHLSDNALGIVDAVGNVVVSLVSEFDTPSREERNRIKFIVNAMNGVADLGIDRVKDFEKAGKPCESVWSRL